MHDTLMVFEWLGGMARPTVVVDGGQELKTIKGDQCCL